MSKLLFSLIAGLVLSFFTVKPAFAADCKVIYGGGPICQGKISITKNVQVPGKGGSFVHTLTINDAHYGANQTVPFQITVQNQGQTAISNLQVVDSLPQYMTFDSGDGSYDPKSKTVTVKIASLAAGQTQTLYLVGRTAASNTLPKNQSVTCVTNKVQTQSGTLLAQDASSLCIDKGGFAGTTTTTPQVFTQQPVTKSPETGPEDFVIPLLAATGSLGFFLKKRRI